MNAVTPAARWQLRLLGGLRLEDGSTVHTRLATRAMTGLLARLALWPDRAHAREELIELLWPGVDIDTGRRRLRQALALLRAVLEPPHGPSVPVLQADRQCIRLLPGTIACDAVAFEAHLRAGQHAEAQQLDRGELLPGFYDDWIQHERTRLAGLRERLRQQAPAPPAQAPAITAAESAAPRHSTAPARSAAGIATLLPAYATRYFSHTHQVDRLLALVQAHRVVTVQGPGGGGKTRLAVQVAANVAANVAGTVAGAAAPSGATAAGPGFDTVLFVELAAVHTPAELLTALRMALRIGSGDASIDPVFRRLEGRQALLVLDNAEQLAGIANELLDGLVRTLPRLHLLITSRSRLGLDGERELRIEPLSVPAAGASLREAAESSAVGLFVDRAAAVRADFHLGERNYAAIAELTRVLDGMPLAIELAASRIRAYRPAQMLRMLGQTPSAEGHTPGLDLLRRPVPPAGRSLRHASMQRAIEWSWGRLHPSHRRLAAAMAVFPGGCDAEMLGSVEDSDDVPGALEQLQIHSMAFTTTDAHPGAADAETDETADGPPRLRLYEPIREYAASQFDTAQTAQWRARQRAWALRWLRALPATPPLPRVRRELRNVQAALASAAADGAGDDAARIVLALQPLQETITVPAETLLAAVQALQGGCDRALGVCARSALAIWLMTAGDTTMAIEMAERAVAGASARGPDRACARLAQATVQWRAALSPAATVLQWLDEAERLAGAAQATELLAAVLNLQAQARYGFDRDAEAALALAEQALAVWQRLGNRHGANAARHNVAVYHFRAGRRLQALEIWEEIVLEAAALHDSRRLAISHSARCAALSEMRRWPQAHAALLESLRQSWQSMRLYEVSYDLWNLPRVLAHLHRPAEAQCLMSFAADFWQTRFGRLTATDERYVRLVQRLVSRQIDGRAIRAATARVREMTLAEAVAMALAG